MDIGKKRREWDEEAHQMPLIDGVEVESIDADGVPCEWVWVAGADRAKVLFFVHGGGFTSGSCVTHRDLASRLSLASGLSALLPGYRLAPEHPFPAGLEDVVAVYRWLLASGFDSTYIAFGGDSAGGNLALAALLSLRDTDAPMPAALALLSPWLDLTFTGESMISRESVDIGITKVDLLRSRAHYIGSDDGADRLMSPLFADLSGLPPMLIHAGDNEILLSDSERLVEKAHDAGVDATLKVWPGMRHVFHGDAATVTEAQQAIDEIGVFLAAKVG
ncbi:MAG: alpha/beta hydrolase [Chloroflexia bacterium]